MATKSGKNTAMGRAAKKPAVKIGKVSKPVKKKVVNAVSKPVKTAFQAKKRDNSKRKKGRT